MYLHGNVIGIDFPGPFRVHFMDANDPVLTKLISALVPWTKGVPFTKAAPRGQ